MTTAPYSNSLRGTLLNQLRATLESKGYAQVVLQADGFTNASTKIAYPYGDTDYGVTFPIPPDSFVTCTVVGAIYIGDVDGTTDTGAGVNFTVSGIRIGTGNATDVEGVNTALEINELAIEMNSTDAATGNTITITAAADTTNQGIAVTFQNDADTEACYFVGLATIVCAKRDCGIIRRPHF